MPDRPAHDIPEDGKLAANITHFARALRKAGLRLGPGRVIGAIRAVAAAGFTDRRDFYWTLHASFVSRPEDRAIFAQTFRLFWRDPRYLEQMMSLLLPSIQGVQEDHKAAAAERRAAAALLDGMIPEGIEAPPAPEDELRIEGDATGTASGEERLRTLDFEQMSPAEMAEARRMIARLHLPVPPLASRRTAPTSRGPIADWRRTIALSLRRGGEIGTLSTRRRRERQPNLVVLCDISGSMSHYSRMVLHFLHAVANERGAGGWAKVHAFTFGTRLTNITRHLARRDVDQALAAAGAEAQDWQGGTRIGGCLHAFNRDWARRVMGQGAVVLLITDGLDRDPASDLAREMERLKLASRRLVWINPLLRFQGFAPRARGIATMLPHVDTLIAGHSVASVAALGAALSASAGTGEKDRLMTLLRS